MNHNPALNPIARPWRAPALLFVNLKNMTIKDPFSYTARWDSVGLDCSNCVHQANANEWPNIKRNYKCGLYEVPLSVELDERNYKNREWFCKDFRNNGSANKNALKAFESIKHLLEVNVLYGCYHVDGFLQEIPFSELDGYK